MKKPRKPKNKSRRASKRGRTVARAPSPAPAKKAHRRRAETAPKTLPRPPIRYSNATAAYEADDRQALALLMLPLFLMAFAVAGTQATRTVRALPDLVAQHAPAKKLAPTVRKTEPTLQERIAATPLTPLAETPTSDGIPVVSNSAADLGTLIASDPPSTVATPVVPEEVQPGSAHKAIASAPITTPQDRTELNAGTPSDTLVAGDQRPFEIAALERDATALSPPSAIGKSSASGPKDPAVCIADENAKMRRTASLAARIPATDPEAFGLALAASAREQLDDFVVYTDKYHMISYPRGDIPALYGVCTDVIIRAYHGVGLDLQELVHKAKVGIGDSNIDHRRVKTLQRFFKKFGETLPISEFTEDYKPGDIVTYYRPQNRGSNNHIAVVSDIFAPSGRPMIIHNRGWGPQQEDALFVDEITGHYRFTGARLPAALRKSLQANAGVSDDVNNVNRRDEKGDVVRASFTPSANSGPGMRSAAP